MHSIEKPCPARGRTGGSRNERRKNSRIGPVRHSAIGKTGYDKRNLTFSYIGLTDHSRLPFVPQMSIGFGPQMYIGVIYLQDISGTGRIFKLKLPI